MYKVLIADDEEIIRRGLTHFVQSDPDFQVVALAEDGRMALEQAKVYKPDLLLVDINMPYLNGLGMTEQLLAVQPDAAVIIISGYDDFAYVQKALRLGVFDYILKPVNEGDFFELLQRVKAHLKEKTDKQRYLTWAKDQVERCKPALLEKFFQKWIYGQLDEIEVYEQIQYLGITIPERYAITAIDLQDNLDQNSSPIEVEWDDNLLYYACQNIVQELYLEEAETICFRNVVGNLIVLSPTLPPERWKPLRDRIISTVEQCLNVKMILVHTDGVGVLNVPDTIDNAIKQLHSKLQYSNLVAQTLQLVEQDLDNSSLSLQSIATKLFVSPQHLSRVFKHETGDTFGAYLAQMRVRKAMVLLRDPKLKMYEVAEKAGYSSQHYFSSAFKKVLGISPVEYRKNMLGYGSDKRGRRD